MDKDNQSDNSDLNDFEKFYTAESKETRGQIDHRPRRSIWQRLLFLSVGMFTLASLIGWLGFYVFGVFEAQQKGKLEISFEAPEKNVSAEAITYKTILKNNSSDRLENIRLIISYPDGFVLDNASLTPEGQAKNEWSIGQLEAMSSKEILLQGRLLGEPGNMKTIYAEAKYKLPNISSELQTSVSLSTVLEEPKLILKWQGPVDTKPGETVDYSLEYQYGGESFIPASQLKVIPPANFVATKTEPAVKDLKDPTFDLSELKPADKGTIKVTGKWQSGTDSPSILEAKLLVPLPSGAVVNIASKQIQTVVVNSEVSIHVDINGADVPTALSLGDDLNIRLTIDNASDKTVSDIEATVSINGQAVDWSQAELPEGGRIQNQTVSWSSSQVAQLQQIAPKAQVKLNINLSLKKVPPDNEGSWQVSVAPHLIYHKLNNDVVDKSTDGAVVQIPVSSPLNLSVQAFYFSPDGGTLGSGPLPPKVGQTTRYRLIWRLQGAVHRLVNLTVQANLPDQVKVVAGTNSSAFGSFISDDDKPIWKLPAVEAGLEPSLEFTVELTPAKSDVGKILILSGQTTVQGEDDVTRGQVAATGTVATTNLDSDAAGRGQGVVEAAD